MSSSVSTSKISAAQVRKVAKMAKLDSNPSDEFVAKFQKQLGDILAHVEELALVDTTGILPTDGISTISVSQLRVDQPAADQERYQRIRKNIIANFPRKQGDLLIVPGIFEE